MGIDKVWTGLQIIDNQSKLYAQLSCWVKKRGNNSPFHTFFEQAITALQTAAPAAYPRTANAANSCPKPNP
jgi:hypothetical protein